MYDIADYGRMIADPVRTGAYVDAMKATIKPGDVVVDLGAGTGIMTLWACELGARHVYAIEPNAGAVAVAKRICRDNGFADRVTFFPTASTNVVLPERADVIVSDLRGKLPVWPRYFDAIDDARARLLREGGAILPKRDTLGIGVVEAPEAWDWYLLPWRNDRFNLSAAVDAIVNDVQTEPNVPAPVLVSEKAKWAEIDYAQSMPVVLEGSVELVVTRDASAHALSLWFDAEIADGIGFSTAPGNELVYSRLLALFPQPLAVEERDVVAVHVVARRAEDAFVWGWTTRHLRGGDQLASFRQTSFFAAPSPPVQYDRTRVELSPHGRLALAALSRLGQSAEPLELRALADALGAATSSPADRAAIAAAVRQIAQNFCVLG